MFAPKRLWRSKHGKTQHESQHFPYKWRCSPPSKDIRKHQSNSSNGWSSDPKHSPSTIIAPTVLHSRIRPNSLNKGASVHRRPDHHGAPRALNHFLSKCASPAHGSSSESPVPTPLTLRAPSTAAHRHLESPIPRSPSVFLRHTTSKTPKRCLRKSRKKSHWILDKFLSLHLSFVHLPF